MTREEKIKYAIKELKGIIEFEESHGDRNYFDYCGCITIGSAKMALKALEQQTCKDAISRQVAIDAMYTLCDTKENLKENPWRDNPHIDAVVETIEQLPSVNPQPKWIPVSEEMPKGSDIVLLSLPPHTTPDGEECSASVICGHYIGGKDKEWGLSDGDTCGYGIVSIRKGTNPIAWMPLPKPYEPQESEVEE